MKVALRICFVVCAFFVSFTSFSIYSNVKSPQPLVSSQSLKRKFIFFPSLNGVVSGEEPNFDVGNLVKYENTKKYSKKKLAVIVPIRNAFEDLVQMVPHITKFISKQEIPFHIFCIQQLDDYRFSRGSLMNVGFLYTKEKFDYIVTHDVDLLPLNPKLTYEYPPEGIYHMAAHFLCPPPILTYVRFDNQRLTKKKKSFSLLLLSLRESA